MRSRLAHWLTADHSIVFTTMILTRFAQWVHLIHNKFPTRKHRSYLFGPNLFTRWCAWVLYSFIGVASVAWNSWLGTTQLPFLYHDALLAFWVRLGDALEDWKSERDTSVKTVRRPLPMVSLGKGCSTEYSWVGLSKLSKNTSLHQLHHYSNDACSCHPGWALSKGFGKMVACNIRLAR